MTHPANIGRYEILRPLGAGGMGKVYLARDGNGRMAAVKIMHEHIAQHSDGLPRLRREVEALRRVKSPHVAQILDYDVDGAVAHVATRYVEGLTLQEIVTRRGPLSRAELRRLGIGLGRALEVLHRAEIVHRDLKPSNVMMVNGDPVVIDLGIALVVGMTRMTHGIVGTPAYLAPEVRAGRTAEPAADVYGWGVVMAFAATGGDGSSLPRDLAPVVEAALAADPARRPQANELVDAVEQALGLESARSSYQLALQNDESAQAEVIAAQIDALLPEISDLGQAVQVLLDVARDARNHEALDRSADWYARARALSIEDGARASEGWALDGLAFCARARGDHDRAARYSAEALGIAVQIGEPAMQAWSLSHLGHWARHTGKAQRAVELYEQAREFAGRHGLRDVEGWAGDGLGGTLLDMGSLERAATVFAETRDIALEHGDLALAAWSMDNLGNCSRRNNAPATAETAYQGALELARRIGHREIEGWALVNLARCRESLGDPRAASELFDRAEPIARALDNATMQAEVAEGFDRLRLT
ncbi:protein kinase domain-containing protein [Actinomadura rugatobispora]|uniref:Tetratricopeptide repeat protein n=1 Tax=Actinomadura rugatobispora TaxID=1994 RepID=A0ABW0ZP60_9ACTN|nr:hypothetical protein GCM10010200_059220 [Actinomadura rugatobispora]